MRNMQYNFARILMSIVIEFVLEFLDSLTSVLRVHLCRREL